MGCEDQPSREAYDAARGLSGPMADGLYLCKRSWLAWFHAYRGVTGSPVEAAAASPGALDARVVKMK